MELGGPGQAPPHTHPPRTRPAEEAHRGAVCARKHPTRRRAAVRTRALTAAGARGRRPSAHPPPPPARGEAWPGSAPPLLPRMFPSLACQVPGERASEMRREPLGEKLELAVPCPPRRRTPHPGHCGGAGRPASPRPPPRRPSPRRLPRPPVGLGGRAAPRAGAGLAGRPAAYLRCSGSEAEGRPAGPRGVGGGPRRRTISVLSAQECGSRGGGGGVGRGPSGQP